MAALGPVPQIAGARIAVAVSGGADSMALALCAARWAPGRVLALTVDHGLRSASADEAAAVAGWMAARGIDHRILAWTGAKPVAGIQAAAREARHRLLTDACRGADIGDLLLAHHAHDQAETVLMRLGRGSGPSGLRGMAAVRQGNGIRLLRPLLDIAPDRLRATLIAAGQPWIEDPSNADRRFQRVRLRQLLPALVEAGVTVQGIAAAARHIAAAEAALDADLAALVAASVQVSPAGYARLDPAPFRLAHPELRRRLVEGLAHAVGGQAGHLDRSRAQRLGDAVAAGLDSARTFGGCRFVPQAGTVPAGTVLVCREWARIAPETPLAPDLVWDGRFRVTAETAEGISLRPLGDAPLPADMRHRAAVPAAARPALPALWHGTELLAVPHLGYGRRAARSSILKAASFTFAPQRLTVAFDSVLAPAAPCVISL